MDVRKTAVLTVALFALAGCGAARTGIVSGSAKTAGAAGAAKARSGSTAGVHHVGSTVAVEDGNGAGLDVTLLRYDDAVRDTDGFNLLHKGNHLVAVELRIAVPSGPEYNGNPDDAATLLDASGHQFAAEDFDPETTAGRTFGGTAVVTAGGSASGTVVFQVPVGDTVTGLRFAPDPGIGNSSEGRWSISAP